MLKATKLKVLFSALTVLAFATAAFSISSFANDSTISISPATHYEFEDFDLSGGTQVENNHTGYSGDGFVDHWDGAGALATFEVNAQTAGTATLNIRYANGQSSAKTLSLYVNGTKQKTMSFPVVKLSNWDKWGTMTDTVDLSAGNDTITIQKDSDDSGQINLDCLDITFPGAAAGSSSQAVSSSQPASSQPASSSRPASSQPASSSQPAASSQPVSSSQPAASSQPAISSQPADSSQAASSSIDSDSLNSSAAAVTSNDDSGNSTALADNSETPTGTAGNNAPSHNPNTGDAGVIPFVIIGAASSVVILLINKK